MPKYPSESAIKSYFLLGQQLKIQRIVATDQIVYGTEYTVILRKFSQDNLQMFLFQPTPFSICLAYTASFFSFKYTSKYRTMTICEYTFDD